MAASDISGIEQSWDIALAVDFIFVILALLLCLFRLISELTNGDGRELADDLIIVASIINFALSALHMWLSFHMTPVKRSHIASDFVPKINFIIHILWVSEIFFTTCSVLAYYYRIFQRLIKNGKAKAMIWVPFTFVLVWAISSILLALFVQGWPPSRYWTTGPNEAYQARIWYTNALHFCISLAVLAVPVRWIKMKEPDRVRRWAMTLLFLTGILTLIVCVIRVYFLVKRVSIDSEEGRFAYSIRAVMLSVIESNTAIICANLPTLEYGAFANWFSAHVKKERDGEDPYERKYSRESHAAGSALRTISRNLEVPTFVSVESQEQGPNTESSFTSIPTHTP